MCWKTYNGKPEKKKAEKDIPVFKICLKDRFSNGAIPYYFIDKLVYHENKTYHAEPYLYVERIGSYCTMYCISDGLHSYSAKHMLSDTRFGVEIITESNGNLGEYGRNHTCLLLCTIPEGAEYYLNECGEYVSNKLVVKHILPLTRCIGNSNRAINQWRNLKFDNNELSI
jgi:hypothetical protein